MNQTWHVSLSFTTTSMPEELPFTLMEELGQYGAAMSVERDLTGGTVTLTVESDSAPNACLDAVTLVSQYLASTKVPHTVTGVSAQSEADFQSGMDTPTFPEVVGYAEIAELAGVSRQRARQFAQIAGFPKPVIVTAQGPLMTASAVKKWLMHRNTRRHTPASQ